VCFSAKEIQDRHAVLSERAVLIRVHRINAPTSERSASAGTGTNCPNDAVEQEMPNEAKKNSQNVKHFSLKDLAGFLPISLPPSTCSYFLENFSFKISVQSVQQRPFGWIFAKIETKSNGLGLSQAHVSALNFGESHHFLEAILFA